MKVGTDSGVSVARCQDGSEDFVISPGGQGMSDSGDGPSSASGNDVAGSCNEAE